MALLSCHVALDARSSGIRRYWHVEQLKGTRVIMGWAVNLLSLLKQSSLSRPPTLGRPSQPCPRFE